MAQVFISYQKRDRALVERIRDGLTAAGLSVWWDDDVTPRENWDRILEREIASADFVLVLWTRNSVESDWVRIEANYARNCKPSKLVQARFDHSTVPIAFSLIQYVDLDWAAPERSGGWPKLLEWLGKPKPAAPPPPAPPVQPLDAGPEATIPWRGVRDALTLLHYACGALITLWGLLMVGLLINGPIFGGSFTSTDLLIIISTIVLSLAAGLSFIARAKLSSKLIYAWAVFHVVATLAGPEGGSLSGSRIFGYLLLATAAGLAFTAARTGWLRR